MGIPSRADYTVWHQNSSQNFTSQLDKTLNKLRKNKVMRKTKENTNTLPLQRLKKRTNVKMSKGQLDCARRHRPKTNITNPSASMSYWSAQICCHTHLLFSSQKLQKKKNTSCTYLTVVQFKLHSTNFNQCKLPTVPGNDEKRKA